MSHHSLSTNSLSIAHIIHQLYPIKGEPVIDKPGKGSFHATDLHQILLDRGIKTLIVCGVTVTRAASSDGS